MDAKNAYVIECTSVETTHIGVHEILKFYSYAKKLKYTSIKLTLLNVQHIDANLSSLLFALIKKLKDEQKLYVFVEIPQHMHVLIRNGFIPQLSGTTEKVFDERDSVIPFKQFNADDDDGFATYLTREFFSHRGLDNLSHDKKIALRTAFLEVFTNVLLHANIDSCFTCGQYFPGKGVLKFSLVDTGQGFLRKIKAATNGEVDNARSAIDWAVLPGHSTKARQFGTGGYGLSEIHKYCKENNGSLHIASGDCYWMASGKNPLFSSKLREPFPGAMVNLIFRDVN
jgi:hypothetical protein